MKEKYIDIGINFTNKQFRGDIETIINIAVEAGIEQMILTVASVENILQSASLAKKYPGKLYSTVGIHPHDA